MTHRQSINGRSRPIASVPMPVPAAQPRRWAGSITPGREISLRHLRDDPSSATTGTDLKVYIKEMREKE